MGNSERRKCSTCYGVKLKKENLCNGIAAAIDKLQAEEKKRTGRKPSKEKIILKTLRKFFEGTGDIKN
jgi:hypothetical protein